MTYTIDSVFMACSLRKEIGFPSVSALEFLDRSDYGKISFSMIGPKHQNSAFERQTPFAMQRRSLANVNQ